MAKRGWSARRSLDVWFPTIVRYVGLALLLYAAWTKQVALVTAGTGMILFKTITGAGKDE